MQECKVCGNEVKSLIKEKCKSCYNRERMNKEKLNKLNVLYRSKVIKEMTLEDLEIWEKFEKIYPSCLRFPESIEWNLTGNLRNRKKIVQEIKKSLKKINVLINLIVNNKFSPGKRNLKLFKEQEQMLKIHLKKLKEVRDKRLNEKLEIPFRNSQTNEETKK